MTIPKWRIALWIWAAIELFILLVVAKWWRRRGSRGTNT